MLARAFAIGLLGCALSACGPAKPSKVPCDDGDTVDLTGLAAACFAKLDACSTQACVDDVQAECNKQVEARCGDPR